MKLGRILKGMAIHESKGDSDREIAGLAYDSREVKPGYLFVALRGNTRDGHNFVKEAVRNGAVAVVLESAGCGKDIDKDVSVVRVPDSRAALSKLAAEFYGHPYKNMTMVGITGTNGKTTTSYLLESILLAAGARPGVIGTINDRLPEKIWEAHITTPESLELMKRLHDMAEAGVTHVVMEVSSHALDQGRVKDCPFQVAVFTNISRDHLDYHKSIEAYFEAKSRLFLGLCEGETGKSAKAVINVDDPKGRALAGLTDAPVVTYGQGRGCDFRADGIQVDREGITARLITPGGEIGISSRLLGGFNIYNILAAAAAAICLDVDPDAVASGVANLAGVPGRLELVKNSRSLSVVVDYAHTPDALMKVLEAIKPLVKGRLITVFGCGGDRDKGKRRIMGRVAGKTSDLVFITSDNPRTEDPSAIARQIEEGVRESGLEELGSVSHDRPVKSGYILDLDRGNAISRAVGMADENDFILIAGKGHEDYQITGKGKRHFDDREVAAQAIRDKGTLNA
jgi:UDP-N-acetylmuramoyl-L-alanyl-D-glutamate--2,6-diaminopimelate ligase